MAQETGPVEGQRVTLDGAVGELARLQGTRGTVVGISGATAVLRFDSPKLLGGRQRGEIEVPTAWLVGERQAVASGA